ncbi:DUF6082 family protein [Streptomyces sp. NPDC058657]|uniref:DUF6082 family protein n=1 Tax=unclassified Streptomyces TaxID=2593676 RepID=UPI0036483237
MKPAHALFVLAALGAAQLLLSERQHRQRLALDAAGIHQQWISDTASDSQTLAQWAADGEELGSEEFRQSIHTNRLLAFLSAKYQAGLLDKKALRVQANWVMRRPCVRAYWARYGITLREEEAVNTKDRSFNAIFNDEYGAADEKAKSAT